MHFAAQSPRQNTRPPSRDVFLAGYGCATAAGDSSRALWNALAEGDDRSTAVDQRDFVYPIPALENPPLVCAFPEKIASHRRRLAHYLRAAFAQVAFAPRGDYGVIFASSKGCLEDWVWQEGPLTRDPLMPVLEDFLSATGLQPTRWTCVSNACASAHGAIYLAKRWLASGALEDVLVLAADGVGPFVMHGFRTLGALSVTRCRPFSAGRDGLRLGEAAGALWLSAHQQTDLCLGGVALETEGYAVTRSSENGASLESTLRQVGTRAPSLVVAHGTGTPANDRVEDRVLHSVFGEQTRITASKWCVGHTLGASGIVDTIAAAEALRRKQAFAIHNTETIDPVFRGRYWTRAERDLSLATAQAAVVTSLGFGGMNAALRLEVV